MTGIVIPCECQRATVASMGWDLHILTIANQLLGVNLGNPFRLSRVLQVFYLMFVLK